MATIQIEDLPLENELTDGEMDQLFGAGPRRRTRITYRPPAEVLELRQMLSATPLAGVLNSEVVAFDVTTTGQVAFNLNNGNYSANIELPGGMELDTTALKTLMSGSLAIPGVDPVKAVAALGGLKTSVTTNYDQVQQGLFNQYGGGNVYLSTRQFTDWASPENAAMTIGTAVVTGGATAGQIIQEAKDVILNELGNIYTWLKNKAPAEAEALVAGALKAIVSGKDFNAGNLQIKFVNVNETYTVGLGGAAATIAKGLGSGSPSKSITAVHKGFAIIWKGSGDTMQSLTNSLNKFTGASMSGKGDFGALISKLADRPELKGLGKLADAILKSNPAGAIDALVTSKLAAALGLTPAELKGLYKPGNPIIDLKVTQLDEKLAGLFGKLAAGNEGSVKVNRLQFNLNTYEISAEVAVRHRHSWGSVSEILKAIGKQVGQWADKAGNYVNQKVDALGNTIREVGYKAADKVTEVFNKAGALVQQTIVNSKGFKVLEAVYTNGVKTLEIARDAAGKLVREYWRTGTQEFRNLYTGGIKTAYTVWNNGVNTLHNVWDTAGKAVTKYWVDGTKQISQWFTKGVVSAENIAQAGKLISEKAWNGAVCTLNRVRDAAGKLVSEYWRNGTQEFRNLYTNGVKTAYTVWTNGVNTLHNVWDTAGKSVTKYWVDGTKQISQWFTKGVASAENIVQNGKLIAEKAWSNGVCTLSRVRDAAGKLVSEYWRKGSEEFRNLYTNGVRTAYSAWNNGVNTVHYVWNTAGQKISEYWRDGAKEFSNVYKNGVKVAQNIWENGKNIAQHVWNSAGTYVGNVLSKGGNAVTNTLGSLGIKF